MKTVAIATLFVAGLGLAACAATGANTGPAPSFVDASAGQFSGWVRVTGEEFRLYERETDLATPSQSCVSGALPRNAQRASGDIDGQHVRFIGRAAAWSEHGDGPTWNWQGSRIENACRKDVIILADRVEVIGR